MSSEHAHSALCRVGRHHYVTVNEDNPENREATHLECTRCGKIKDGIDRGDQGWITNRPDGWIATGL